MVDSGLVATGELTPELFGGCIAQIFRRWRAAPLAKTRGRHAILSDAVTANLASTALELTTKVALSSHIIRQILSDEIIDLGICDKRTLDEAFLDRPGPELPAGTHTGRTSSDFAHVHSRSHLHVPGFDIREGMASLFAPTEVGHVVAAGGAGDFRSARKEFRHPNFLETGVHQHRSMRPWTSSSQIRKSWTR